VTSTDYATTKQITNTPAKEAAVSFAPDNRTLVYASERTGNWQLYTAKISKTRISLMPLLLKRKYYYRLKR
jgi:tricorn protease